MVYTLMVSSYTLIVVLLVAWHVDGKRAERMLKSRLAVLERENGIVAKAISSQSMRMDEIADSVTDCQGQVAHLEKGLTSERMGSKIVPRPSKVNFRQFAAAAEKASEPQEQV